MKVSKHLCFSMALAMLVSVVPASWGGTIRHDRADSLYVSLGAEASYASVGRFDFTATSGSYIASGTLIADDWVLTAAHVVDETTSLDFSIGGQTYAAKKWLAHPKWTRDLLGGYDIGLVQLSSPVPEAITPAVRYTGSDELGAVATSAGFGMTGTGLTGAVTFDGKKRAGQNVIDAFYARKKKPRIMLSDFDNPDDLGDSAYGSPIPEDLEYLIAPGDSGGGLFIDFGSGPLLAGVHSFGASFDGLTDLDYGDVAGHTRVSAFDKWIHAMLSVGRGRGSGKGGGHGGGPLSGSAGVANPVPEPVSATLLALGGLTLLRRRRR